MTNENKRPVADLMRTHLERAAERNEADAKRRKVFDDIHTLMGHYANDIRPHGGRATVRRVDDCHVEMTIDLDQVPSAPELIATLHGSSVVFEYAACAAGSGPLLRRQGVNPIGAIDEAAMHARIEALLPWAVDGVEPPRTRPA